MNQSEAADAIDAQALAWVARLDREGGSQALEAELQAWLSGDARRRGAFLRAQAIWIKLDRASLRPAAAAPEARPARWRPSRRGVIGGMGAGLAAGVGGLWLTLHDESYGAGQGEMRHVSLADGSTVEVNTESQVRVAMRRDLRRIKLVSGEAWFQVAKDAERPFVVETGRVRVRAVGTAFAVRRLTDGADVTVTEGVVETWLAGDPAPPTRIAAGGTARVRESGAAKVEARVVQAAEIDRKLAWRVGRIEFDGDTLAEAVAEFNRYNARKLRLADAGLADKRFHGMFRTDDPEGFARTAAVTLGGRVEASPDQIVILSGNSTN